jgi:hypothetical protein
MIGADLVGGSVSGTTSLTESGFISAGRIASVHVGGSIVAGTNSGTGKLAQSGSIRASHDIGAITVGHDLIGNSTESVLISARGQAMVAANATTDVAIASLKVGGRVEFANILAGYDINGNAVNSAAQIGKVSVGGDWIASNLVAGASAGTDMQFGTSDDQVAATSDAGVVVSQIGPMVITGQVLGDPNNPDAQFGFVTQHVVSMKVGGSAIALKAGPDNDHLLVLDAAGTVTVNEV